MPTTTWPVFEPLKRAIRYALPDCIATNLPRARAEGMKPQMQCTASGGKPLNSTDA